MIYKGSCHCGVVQFEINAPASLVAATCNCSICTKSGYLHVDVSKSEFTLISGEENLTTYRFNKKIAEHTFCKTCGIKPFYVPRTNPSGYSINVHCLDTEPNSLSIRQFDGKNWEATMANRDWNKHPYND